MSMSHHGTPEEQEIQNQLLDQFLNRSVPKFPAGHLNAEDQGQLSFAVAVDPRKKIVIVQFGKSVDWLGLRKQEAEQMGNLLLEKAKSL